MSEILLQTKLYIPPVRSSNIPRPRLSEKLNEGLGQKLALISAPAGFGKTTLVADWLSGVERPFVWLSLDEDDNDLSRFFTYAAAAIQQIEGVGNSIQELLQSPQPAPLKSLATAFINDCAAVSTPFILVLDDYHTIMAAPVHEAVAFLLDNLPPQLQLVITSRTDPLLPLPRLRARGQMTELRTDDLRFTAEEAASFLQQVMGLDLSVEELSALETRTEGWIAGLRLAALSIQGLKANDEISTFIADFTGSHRYIFDYLTDEVLRKRPPGTRDFLLFSSILNHLSGPLCDAVTGNEDGQRILEQLDAANLFIVPLDNERRWYRYHHLFADLLQHRLRSAYPHQVTRLHQRASAWFEKQDMPIEAIRYAVNGQDWERAARLVELNGRAWLASSQLGHLLHWLQALPQWLVQARPNLGLFYGWAMALTNQFDTVEPTLQAAQEAFQAALSNPQKMVELGVDDPQQQAMFRGYLATCRAALARSQGDFQGSIALLNQALDLFDKEDWTGRSVAQLYLGYALWMSGDVPAARDAFILARQYSRKSGQFLTFVAAMDSLGKILLELGELRQAGELHQQILTLAEEQTLQTGQPPPGVGVAHSGLAAVLYERNDLKTAVIHAAKGIEIFKPWGVTEHLLDSYDILARIKLAQGDVSGALSLAQTAVSLVQEPQVPDWLQAMTVARQARLRLMAGNTQAEQMDTVARWAAEAGLDPNDRPGYLRELEYILLARLLLLERKPESALPLLYHLEGQADNGGRNGRLIEILVLEAISLHDVGKFDEALTVLEKALAMAEPQGYVRIFVDEAEALRPLFLKLPATPYQDALLILLNQESRLEIPSPLESEVNQSTLIDPLSERELEVLALLTSHLSGPQIAEQLHISPNTFKTHTKNIYSKLNVTSRSTAVSRAQELGLLS